MTTDTTYLRHFAFTRFPFAANLQADELFAFSAHHEAVARLMHLLQLRGLGLLTGEVGCGKTTVCRHVTANLHPGLFRVYYVSLTTGNVLDMYKAIAWELGHERQNLTPFVRPGRREKAENVVSDRFRQRVGAQVGEQAQIGRIERRSGSGPAAATACQRLAACRTPRRTSCATAGFPDI